MPADVSPDPQLTESERAQWRAFTLMSRRVMSAVEASLQRDAGLSGADFEILDALSNSAHHRARSKDIAEMLSWEKSRISHHVTRMVDRGLVIRTECEADLRSSWVQLTDHGRDALASGLPHYAAAVRRTYLGRIDDAEATTLGHIAIKVVQGDSASQCRVEIDEIEATLRQ